MAVPCVAWLQRNALYDAYRLHGYQAPAAIVQLATDDTMTDKSRRLFYVYHPSLENKVTFNTHCSDSEKTIVLGCYILQKGIYLYNIEDPRLTGVEQVTAAHEMLHAAYDRLGQRDKKQIDSLIVQAYANVGDKRIRATIDDYRKAGADTTNELHSILGTEVRNLPPDLEHYYARYFNNRGTVVGFSEKYESAFSERQAQADQYADQLASLKTQIDSLNADLTAEKATLDSQYAQLQGKRNNISDVNAFNAQVANFNAAVTNYNAKVSQDSALIDQYNAIIDQYKALVGEQQQLFKAIDSRPGTVQSQ